jgi:hypothetical protein
MKEILYCYLLSNYTQPEILVSVSGTNATCFGEADGSIAVTNSQGATVVITNANNDVVATDLLLEHILTARYGGNEGNCIATAQVTILNLKF